MFGEQSVKRGGKVTKRLVLKQKLVWVKWKTDNLKEDWTAEPLKNFTGDSKAKALKCIEKKYDTGIHLYNEHGCHGKNMPKGANFDRWMDDN